MAGPATRWLTSSNSSRVVVGFLLGFFAAAVLFSSLPEGFTLGIRNQTVAREARPEVDSTTVGGEPGDAGAKNSSAGGTAARRAPGDGGDWNASSAAEAGSGAGDISLEELDGTERMNVAGADLDGRQDNGTAAAQAQTPAKPICDLSDPRFDICDMSGDARTVGTQRTVLYIPPPATDLMRQSSGGVWLIRDQSRKELQWVNKVTVKSLNTSAPAPQCTSQHAVPAVVFSVGALTSNPWHDFSDVLVPLFITARAFNGEVQFLITDYRQWFVDKYALIFKNMSKYEVVDFERDEQVRCYPRVIVGLRSHRDLGIDPGRTPANYTLFEFHMFVREIYSLSTSIDIPYKVKTDNKNDKKPRLLLINRSESRKFVNFPEIMAAVESAGFDVIPFEPKRDDKVEDVSALVDSCDVLMGAHGAGLTNFFFLRTGAVVVQVIPWGHMEYLSWAYYGRQAAEMRLREVDYSISAAESTLMEKYGPEHPAIADPAAIHRQGWWVGMRYYWREQDIRLNVTRFAPTLAAAMALLRA